MSTRGRVGILRDDGKVVSIYQHWDSYPEGLGKILLDNYKDKAKVEKLIALGDCSAVREEVEIPFGLHHSFDNSLPNVTVAYMRDRGETGCEPRINEDEAEFWASDIEEWGYLFKNNKWYFATSHGKYNPKTDEYKEIPADKRKVHILNESNITKHNYD